MKMLFVFVALLASAPAWSAEPKTKPAPVPPPPPAERKPGFWERAWQSTKKGGSRAWASTVRAGGKAAEAVTSPFSRGEKKPAEPKQNWRQLAISMTLEPPTVKLPETRSVRVLVGVVNKGKFAAQLDFPTTQRIEVVVKSEAGKVLAKWSDDQRVAREQGFLVINPDERLEYTATVSTREMSPGQGYVIEAYFPSFDQLRASRKIVPSS